MAPAFKRFLRFAVLALVALGNHALAQRYSFATFAGEAGSGYGSNDGTGSAARFNGPQGVAVDSSGNVFVADTGNHTIRKITVAGVVTTLAGSAGSAGSADGAGSAARFNRPVGIAVDGGGNVFVADTGNHAIRRITAGGSVTTLAGTAGSAGSADGVGGAAQFRNPSGVAVDGANVFVADTGNYTIRKIASGGMVTTFAGTAGSRGSTDGAGSVAQFLNPTGVATGSGYVYVADGQSIRKVSPVGVVTTFAGPSTAGSAIVVNFDSANGVAVDGIGTVIVSDSAASIITKVGGLSFTRFVVGSRGSSDGAFGVGQVNHPFGIAADSSGNIFVADTDNNTIREVTILGVVTTLAGSAGHAGTADGTGSVAQFNVPNGVGVDGNGNVFVADETNHSVRKITPTGVVTTWAGVAGVAGGEGSFGAPKFYSPHGLAVDSGGNVFVADTGNNAIRKITAAGVVTTWAGFAVSYMSGVRDGDRSDALFSGPQGVAVDSGGNVFVADTGNGRIRKITAAGVVTTLAGSGNSGTADGVGSAARFFGPQGVAVDSGGNVFVADTRNHTIRKITASGVVTTLAGSGGRAGSADGLGGAARFNAPNGVAVDASGNVFVADTGNNAIRKITATGMVTTLGGVAGIIGHADGMANAAEFYGPKGIAVDGNGNLLVADSGNDTIRKGVLRDNWLVNLSVLTSLGGSGDSFTIGTVIGGAGTSGNKPVLVRAAGPSLAQFGIAPVLADPTMRLFNTSGASSTVVAVNNDWGGGDVLNGAFAQVGAFPFTNATSKDAALYQNGATALAAGSYTVNVTAGGFEGGLVIAELYDATPRTAFSATTPRLINLSVLKFMAPGTSLAAGFVIAGSTNMNVLVRAVGPTLGLPPFNYPGVMTKPKIELFNNATGAKLGENTGWGGSAALIAAFASVGAFQLANGTTDDSALMVSLAPGQYSARVSGADGGGGAVIVEVYEAP